MSRRKRRLHLHDHNVPPAGPSQRPERSPSTTRLLRAAGATALTVLHCRVAPRMLLLLLNTAWGRKALRSCAIVLPEGAPPHKLAAGSTEQEGNHGLQCTANGPCGQAQAAAQHSTNTRTDSSSDRAAALHGSVSVAMASITTPPGHPAQNIALICARLKDLKVAVQAPDADLKVNAF